VLIQGIEITNPNIGHTTIHVNYQSTSQPHVTPFVPSKTNVLLECTYPMWYNVIPLYVPLYPSLYPTYHIETKGFDLLILRNYTCYVHGYVHLALKQPIIPPIHTPHIIGN
jgi:hypothetical protein